MERGSTISVSAAATSSKCWRFKVEREGPIALSAAGVPRFSLIASSGRVWLRGDRARRGPYCRSSQRSRSAQARFSAGASGALLPGDGGLTGYARTELLAPPGFDLLRLCLPADISGHSRALAALQVGEHARQIRDMFPLWAFPPPLPFNAPA
jgi:hypothetical protein